MVNMKKWKYTHNKGRLCLKCDKPVMNMNKSGLCLSCRGRLITWACFHTVGSREDLDLFLEMMDKKKRADMLRIIKDHVPRRENR